MTSRFCLKCNQHYTRGNHWACTACEHARNTLEFNQWIIDNSAVFEQEFSPPPLCALAGKLNNLRDSGTVGGENSNP